MYEKYELNSKGMAKTNSKIIFLLYNVLFKLKESKKKSYVFKETPNSELIKAVKENINIKCNIYLSLLLINIISFSVGLPNPKNACINSLLPILNNRDVINNSQIMYTTRGIMLPINTAIIKNFLLFSK